MASLNGLELISLISLTTWALLTLDRSRSWPSELIVTRKPVRDGGSHGTPILVLVPARNEAETLPKTLPALLDQPGVDVTVILVDDDSSDGTAEIARQVAAEIGLTGRLRIVDAPPAQPGENGKVNALSAGLKAAQGLYGDGNGAPDWVLLTDADIWHRHGSVADLLHIGEGGTDTGYFDLVSVMARLRADTWSERLLIPPFVFFFQLLFPFRKVSSSKSRLAAAAGGCILVRREILEESKALESIRQFLIDDVALAQTVKRAGGRLWLGLDSGIHSVRAYDRLADIWRMVARTAFTQLRHSWLLLIATLLALSFVVIAPPFVAGVGIWSLLVDNPAADASTKRAIVWSLLAWALQTAALLPSVRHHGVPKPWALTLPLAALLYAPMTASSAFRHLLGSGNRWKGRAYGGPADTG